MGFTGYDGFTPNSGLIADTAGNLYGTTQQGGYWYEGVVFEVINPASSRKLKCEPIGIVIDETACIAMQQ